MGRNDEHAAAGQDRTDTTACGQAADELTDAQRDYIAAVVAAAPPLSDAAIDQLRALLPPPAAPTPAEPHEPEIPGAA